MDRLLQDLRYGLRSLLRNPGYTLVAVVTLALGIGANTAIFGFVDALLLRPLPYPEPDRLVMLWQDERRRGGPEDEWTSPPNFLDWRAQSTVFEGLAAFTGASATITGRGEAEQVPGARVSPGFFRILGVRPIVGRSFDAEEEAAGAGRVVVLSHALWQRRFDADPGVVGGPVTINGDPYTVVGVLPPDFEFPFLTTAEAWMPLADPANICGRRCIFLRVVGRLAPGASLERANAEMATIGRRLEAEYPNANTGVDVAVTTLHDRVAGPVRPALLTLLGAVGFLLLIACANVANLMLARAAGRDAEIAVRTALGADRRRLMQQLLTEGLVLAAAGGGLGTGFALFGIDLLAALAPAGTPRVAQVGMDLRMLAFSGALTLVTGALFGTAPALHLARRAPQAALREAGRGTHTGRLQRRLRGALVVSELALALVLLAGAGLLLRSFIYLRQVDLGIRTESTLTARVVLPPASYAPERVGPFIEALLERLGAQPGVRSVAAVSTVPLGGGLNDVSFAIEGRPEPRPGEAPVALIYDITPEYFRTLGIALRAGRTFTDRDRADAPPVVVIDEELARRHFPGEDPIGKRLLRLNGAREIVGVVSTVRHSGAQVDVRPALYLPHAQSTARGMSVLMAVDGDPLALAGPLRAELRDLDPDLAAAGITTMEALADGSLAQQRMSMLLLSLFAAVALLLASFGIYGVISYSVARRTSEIGLRMALGADRDAVLRLVLRQGMGLVAIGLGIGTVLALALARLVSGLLYGTGAADPVTFGAVAALLAGVALLACWLPARRAAGVDPIIALRTD